MSGETATMAAAPRNPLPAGLALALGVILADQATKLLVLRHFAGTPERMQEVTAFFNLVLTFNHGVTFGFFNGAQGSAVGTTIFSVAALTIVAALIWWLRSARHALTVSAIGLVIGGALGNLADRLRLGGVVDFLDFHWRDHHYWAFNIADSAICVGVALLILDGLRSPRP